MGIPSFTHPHSRKQSDLSRPPFADSILVVVVQPPFCYLRLRTAYIPRMRSLIGIHDSIFFAGSLTHYSLPSNMKHPKNPHGLEEFRRGSKHIGTLIGCVVFTSDEMIH